VRHDEVGIRYLDRNLDALDGVICAVDGSETALRNPFDDAVLSELLSRS